MSGRNRLDLRWWKKNRPNSLRQGAVETALEEFDKVVKEVQRSHQYGLLFKSLGKLKAAIAKDAQVLRKSKDKGGLKFLADFEKLAHSKVQAKQKHLSISGLSHTGFKSNSGVRAEAGTSGGDELSRIIRTGDASWSLVKSDKAVSGAKSKKVHALPKGIAASSLSGWKKEQVRWSCIAESDAKAPAVQIKLMLEYEWAGRHPDGGGAFLSNCGLWATDVRIAGGYSADLTVEVKKVWNAGSSAAPVGALSLVIAADVSSSIDKISQAWTIECLGNNKRDIKKTG